MNNLGLKFNQNFKTMTQMRRLIFAVVLFGTMTFTGCALQKMVKMAKKQETTVTPNPLEVHADTVNVDMSAVLPVKMLKKGKVYTVNTFYKYGEQEVALETVEFKAADYPNNAKEQPRKSEDFSFACAVGIFPISRGMLTFSKAVNSGSK